MNKIKTVLILILIVIVVYLNLRLKHTTTLQKRSKVSCLDSNLKSQIVIENQNIIYKTRNNEKTQKPSHDVHVTSRYLPPEGKAEIDVDLNGNTTELIKSKGLVFEPSISVLSTFEEVKLGLGARLAYWNRYGLSIGLNTTFSDTYKLRCFVGVDRRLSDVLPLLKNTTVGIVYDGTFGVYISTFF